MENALNAYTGWLILGAVLMILEIVVPGVFLLWICLLYTSDAADE